MPSSLIRKTTVLLLFVGVSFCSITPTFGQSEKQPKAVQKKKQRKGMVAATAMMIPGVDPAANGELRKISSAFRKEFQGESESFETALASSVKAYDELLEKHLENKRFPRTANYVLESKIRTLVMSLQKSSDAEKLLAETVSTLTKKDPKSDLTATATAMQLFYTKLNSMKPGEKAEALVSKYLEMFPKKTWSGRLVFVYGTKLGTEARLKWFEKNLSKVSKSDASQMRRQIAISKLVGSKAKISGAKVDGKDFDIKDLKGKVVLIDFWATWCGPCVREMPEIKEVYEEYHEKGFEVVSYSLDRSKDRVESFLEENEYDWIQIYEEDEEQRKMTAERFGVTGIPATYLVDQEGKIVKINLRGRRRIEAAVQNLLK